MSLKNEKRSLGTFKRQFNRSVSSLIGINLHRSFIIPQFMPPDTDL
jgi:hypothetical protein